MNETDVQLTQVQKSFYISLIEGGLLLLMSCTGIYCNILAFSVMIRHQVFKNFFGYLAALYTFSNASALFVFILWAVPWTVWEVPDELEYVNLRMGQLSLFFFQTTLLCSLCVSINRFIAITFPMHYRTVFTPKTTYGTIVFVVISETLCWSAFFIRGCDFFYMHAPPGWSYSAEPCSQFTALYIDRYFNTALILIFTCTDVINIGQLKLKKQKAMGRSKTNAARNRDTAREKKEARFLVQAVLTSFTYVILLITGYAFGSLTTTDFGLFLCTTLVWAFVHTAGGAIFVMFNPEIRRHLPCMPKQPSGSESTITNVRVAPPATN